MSIKTMLSLVTLPTNNEQTNANLVTVTGNGTSREYPELGQLENGLIFLNITAVSGTAVPTLSVKFQVQDPVSLVWHDWGVFPDQTDISTIPIEWMDVQLTTFNYRLAWTVTGTNPSFTFSCCIIVRSEETIPL